MRHYTLPNGVTVNHVNTYETIQLYREIFANKGYVNPGVPISQYLPPDAVVVDCGANIGMFSLFVLQQCPTAWIHAFEPAPAVYEVLRANAEKHRRVTVNNCGLWAECKEEAPFVYLPMATAGSGYHDDATLSGMKERLRDLVLADTKLLGQTSPAGSKELLQYLDKSFEKQVIVPTQVRTLSSYLDEHEIGAVDLLKIDVEGQEEAVLAGIRPNHWPIIRQLVIEVHEVHAGIDASRHIGGLLAERGYRLQSMREEGEFTTIVHACR
jgi:FkbM family methyltransferase